MHLFKHNRWMVYERSYFDAFHLNSRKMYTEPRGVVVRTVDNGVDIPQQFTGIKKTFFLCHPCICIGFLYLGKLHWLPASVDSLKLDVHCDSSYRTPMPDYKRYMQYKRREKPFYEESEVRIPITIKHLLISHLSPVYTFRPRQKISTLEVRGECHGLQIRLSDICDVTFSGPAGHIYAIGASTKRVRFSKNNTSRILFNYNHKTAIIVEACNQFEFMSHFICNHKIISECVCMECKKIACVV